MLSFDICSKLCRCSLRLNVCITFTIFVRESNTRRLSSRVCPVSVRACSAHLSEEHFDESVEVYLS